MLHFISLCTRPKWRIGHLFLLCFISLESDHRFSLSRFLCLVMLSPRIVLAFLQEAVVHITQIILFWGAGGDEWARRKGRVSLLWLGGWSSKVFVVSPLAYGSSALCPLLLDSFVRLGTLLKGCRERRSPRQGMRHNDSSCCAVKGQPGSLSAPSFYPWQH